MQVEERALDFQHEGADGLAVMTNWDTIGEEGKPGTTSIDQTPVIKEKPFLFFDETDNDYKVFVPGIRKDAVGTSWSEGNMGPGEAVSIDDFYVAKEGEDDAASINAAIADGKHIFLTPGIYYANEPIRVDREGTIVLGYGMATVIPRNDEAAMTVGDNNATIAGIIFDAEAYSKNMLVVGTEGSSKDGSANPTLLADLFFRIGGVYEGVASTVDALVINSNDVIGDHFWLWRADHGDGTGWDLNKAENGMIANGDNITMYGLFSEHFQKHDVWWRGENGRTFFLQNEKAYDPQDQKEWMSHNGNKRGYAAYKVADDVENHYAVGLGVYDVFINTNGADMYLDNAIEVPNKPNVRIENACVCTFSGIDEDGFGLRVGIKNIVNGVGKGCGWLEDSSRYNFRGFLLSYCNGDAVLHKTSITAKGEDPSTYDEAKEPETDKPGDDKPCGCGEVCTCGKDTDKGCTCGGTTIINNITNTSNCTCGESKQDPPQQYLYDDQPEVGKTYTVGNYKYKVISLTSKTASVVGVKKKTLKSIYVKSTVKISGVTFKVTEVAKNAFKNCKKATKVTIGKNVKLIDSNAFYNCKKVKTVTIKSAALTKIGSKAFYNCKKLKKVVIKSTKLKTVGKKAFKNISSKATIKVPKKKVKKYKKILKNKGQKASVKIKK